MGKETAHKVIVNYLKELCEKSSASKENSFIGICLDGQVRMLCKLISDIAIPENDKDGIKQELQKITEMPTINGYAIYLIQEAIKKI